MHNERDLLFAVLALQSDLLNAEQFIEACTAWSAQKNGSMSGLLLEWGYLSPTDAKSLDYLVARRLAKNGGNVGASLAGISDERWRWALASLNDPYIQQVLNSTRDQSRNRAGPTPAEQVQLANSGAPPQLDLLLPRQAHPAWLTQAMVAVVVLVLAIVGSAIFFVVRERGHAQEAKDAAEDAVRKAAHDRERVDSLTLEVETLRKQVATQSQRADASAKQLEQAKADADRAGELARGSLQELLRMLDAPFTTESQKDLRRKLQGLLGQLGGTDLTATNPPANPPIIVTPPTSDTPTPKPGADQLEPRKRAVENLEKLTREKPANLEHQRDLALAYRQLSEEYLSLGQFGPAEDTARKAVSVCEKLVSLPGKTAVHQAALAGCHRHLANVYRRTSKYKEAESSIRAALAILDKLAEDDPRAVEYQSALAAGQQELSLIYLAASRPQESEGAIRKAIAIQEEVVQAAPKVAAHWSDLALDYHLLGQVLVRLNRLIEAEATHQRALELRDRLVREDADNPDLRAALASTHQQLAGVYQATGRLSQAESACHKAIAARERLTRDFPSLTAYRRDLAVSYRTLGAIHLTAGRFMQADSAYQKALTIVSELVEKNEKDTLLKRDLAATYYEMAGLAAVQAGMGSRAMRDQLAARALEFLAKSQSAGFFQSEADRTRLQSDLNFDSLRSREEFKKFVEGLAKR